MRHSWFRKETISGEISSYGRDSIGAQLVLGTGLAENANGS